MLHCRAPPKRLVDSRLNISTGRAESWLLLGERQRGAPVTFLVRPLFRPQMHEPTLDLAKANWSRQKEVVRVFYKEM